MEAVQAALTDLQQDWATALEHSSAEDRLQQRRRQSAADQAASEQAAAEQVAAEQAAAERAALRAEQDEAYEAVMVADMMRAPPPPPASCSQGVDMKVRFPDGSEEIFAFARTAGVSEVVQLAQARMGKSAPMAVHIRGQSTALDINQTLESCGLVSPHVLLTSWVA